jgi:hypothetical protein
MNWLPGIFRRNQLYGDLGEEMRLHLEERTEQFMGEGMSRKEAEQAARRAFGNATLLEERSREVWQFPLVESLATDLKLVFRRLGKSPGFAATVILTLAIGIGANAAVFSVLNSVLFKPHRSGGGSRVGGPYEIAAVWGQPDGPCYLCLGTDGVGRVRGAGQLSAGSPCGGGESCGCPASGVNR